MRELFDERRAGCGGAEYASASAGGAGDTVRRRGASAGDNASRCGAFFRATAVGAAALAGALSRDARERRARAGRGTPPPPPPPPPAVMPKPVQPIVSATTPTPDPRVGLKAGPLGCAQAAWNMRMLSTTPPTGKVLGATHSDLAFSGNLAIMGNYNGFEIFDISNPSKPVLVQTYLCPASQNDVSVYRNLLFMSSEATNSRVDCGFEGVPEPVSKLRVRGIRVFDIADIKHPKLVTTVQTCRGSHTHTVVPKLGDDANVFIYVSARPASGRPMKCRDARTVAPTIRTRRGSASK